MGEEKETMMKKSGGDDANGGVYHRRQSLEICRERERERGGGDRPLAKCRWRR